MVQNKASDSIRDDGRPTLIYWLVTLLALFWGGFSAADYYLISAENPAYLKQFPAEFIKFVGAYPYWRKLLWLLAIVCAVLGGLFMLFRNRFAVTLLWSAPLALAAGFIGYDILLSEGIEAFGLFGIAWTVGMLFGSLILAMYAARCWDDDLLR